MNKPRATHIAALLTAGLTLLAATPAQAAPGNYGAVDQQTFAELVDRAWTTSTTVINGAAVRETATTRERHTPHIQSVKVWNPDGSFYGRGPTPGKKFVVQQVECVTPSNCYANYGSGWAALPDFTAPPVLYAPSSPSITITADRWANGAYTFKGNTYTMTSADKSRTVTWRFNPHRVTRVDVRRGVSGYRQTTVTDTNAKPHPVTQPAT